MKSLLLILASMSITLTSMLASIKHIPRLSGTSATLKSVTLRTYLGESCWNKFSDGSGNLSYQEITRTQYDAINGKNLPVPPVMGQTWVNSSCGHKFNTSNGQLNPGDYYAPNVMNVLVNKGGQLENAFRMFPAIDIASGTVDTSLPSLSPVTP